MERERARTPRLAAGAAGLAVLGIAAALAVNAVPSSGPAVPAGPEVGQRLLTPEPAPTWPPPPDSGCMGADDGQILAFPFAEPPGPDSRPSQPPKPPPTPFDVPDVRVCPGA